MSNHTIEISDLLSHFSGTNKVWEASNTLTVFVNGKCKQLTHPDPRMTLLTFLRAEGLKGTKLGCGEGGCGACTVMLSKFDASTGKIKHISANACLTPLCSLDGMAVTTIEGIGGMRQGLHPVQERIATLHGSQCGFCTPGIVMSLYSFLRANPHATPQEIEDCLDGNLCRCTGYRPILDAAKSLSNNKGGCCGGGGCGAGNGGGCCGGGGGGSGSGDGEGDGSGCPCKSKSLPPPPSQQPPTTLPTDSNREWVRNTTEDVITSHPQLSECPNLSEPIFPPPLMSYQGKTLQFQYTYKPTDDAFPEATYTWYQPLSLMELLAIRQSLPNARLVCGNTEVGIETKFKGCEYRDFINPCNIPVLKEISIDTFQGVEGLRVGGAVTINDFRDFIKRSVAAEDKSRSHRWNGLVAIQNQLSWFASNQIRNVAVVAGNIATASPISDLNPMLLAHNATLKLSALGAQANYVPMRDFFLAYRKVKRCANSLQILSLYHL